MDDFVKRTTMRALCSNLVKFNRLVFFRHQFQKTLKKMIELDPEEDEIDSCLENLRKMRGMIDEDEEVC